MPKIAKPLPNSHIQLLLHWGRVHNKLLSADLDPGLLRAATELMNQLYERLDERQVLRSCFKRNEKGKSVLWADQEDDTIAEPNPDEQPPPLAVVPEESDYVVDVAQIGAAQFDLEPPDSPNYSPFSPSYSPSSPSYTPASPYSN